MSSQLLTPSSHIFTCFRCQNCGVNIDQVSWKQCIICKRFNLCGECEKYPYTSLEPATHQYHTEIHENIGHHDSITSESLQSVLVVAASEDAEGKAQEFYRIMGEKKIKDDYDMSVVIAVLNEMGNRPMSPPEQEQQKQLGSMIVEYHMQAYKRTIRVLSLDGGGIRGYMSIKVLSELIKAKYLADIEQFDPNNSEHRNRFKSVQSHFADRFDYFVGTSTGALVAFCLAINYDILDVMDIYLRSSYYFNRHQLGPLIYAKYNPSRIHGKIDEIIGTITLKNGKQLSAQDATLLDIHNFLNPNDFIDDDVLKSIPASHGHLLEFVDDDASLIDTNNIHQGRGSHCIKREKVLLIAAYNATKSRITVFNTSYAKHWPYRLADVLKGTMAAPTYFPPHEIPRGIIENGHFVPSEISLNGQPDVFIDGGIFANDPELVALWALRLQWKKMAQYHLLSIGTGCHTFDVSSQTWGGYCGWIFDRGLLVNIMMDATRSLTELVTNNLAKIDDIRRMKFNYCIQKSMKLDDPSFVPKFDEEWKRLKDEDDFKALVYFYNNYIHM